jgi:hypothetical protein
MRHVRLPTPQTIAALANKRTELERRLQHINPINLDIELTSYDIIFTALKKNLEDRLEFESNLASREFREILSERKQYLITETTRRIEQNQSLNYADALFPLLERESDFYIKILPALAEKISEEHDAERTKQHFGKRVALTITLNYEERNNDTSYVNYNWSNPLEYSSLDEFLQHPDFRIQIYEHEYILVKNNRIYLGGMMMIQTKSLNDKEAVERMQSCFKTDCRFEDMREIKSTLMIPGVVIYQKGKDTNHIRRYQNGIITFSTYEEEDNLAKENIAKQMHIQIP